MCLVTTQKRVKIAKEDITVYKILTEDLKTVFQSFTYEKNKLYQTEIKSSGWGTYFDGMDQALYEYKENKIFYNQGFHSFNSLELARSFSPVFSIRRVFECIIPKGSRYYTNKLGYMVSNQIIIKGRA